MLHGGGGQAGTMEGSGNLYKIRVGTGGRHEEGEVKGPLHEIFYL
jgi:hypothetical protein